MRIWHISDTHRLHGRLEVPTSIDMVIHSGDTTNHRNHIENSVELWPFLDWFKNLPVKYKVLVAGNHDSAIEHRMVTAEDFWRMDIIYLENNFAEVEGFKIYGSPVTPTYNDWCFMMKRHTIQRVWNVIPEDTDILVTHGPPKYVMDLTENRQHELEQVGDKALLNKVLEIEPMLHCFGHVHDFKEIRNAGILQIGSCQTTFSNAACVQDGKMDLKHNGNIVELHK